jgi:hypothetical protein
MPKFRRCIGRKKGSSVIVATYQQTQQSSKKIKNESRSPEPIPGKGKRMHFLTFLKIKSDSAM